MGEQIERPASSQPIPENAQKVFSGVMFDVYQWDQPQFDGTVKVFEKIRRDDTVTVIPVTDDGNILVQYERQPGKKPFTSVSGGRIDEGEGPELCAHRELLEETGYKAGSMHFYFAYQGISKIDWVDYVFIARGCTYVQPPELDSGEEVRVEKVTFDAFCEFIAQPEFQNTEIFVRYARLLLKGKKDQIHKELFG